MKMRIRIVFCFILCISFLFTSCGHTEVVQQNNASVESSVDKSKINDALPPAEATEADDNVPSTPSEIILYLNSMATDENKVFWRASTDEIFLPEQISIYQVNAIEGSLLWKELCQSIPDIELLSEETISDNDSSKRITFSISGKEYEAIVYSNGQIDFIPAPCAAETILAVLTDEFEMGYIQTATGEEINTFYCLKPGITEEDAQAKLNLGIDAYMDCFEEVQETTDLQEYSFTLDGLVIDSIGYSTSAGMIYPGPSLNVSTREDYMGVGIYFQLEDVYELIDSDFLFSLELSCELIETYAESIAWGAATLTIFDSVALVYYYDWDEQLLLPAWQFNGIQYRINPTGSLSQYSRSYLVDAQTGQIVR